MEPRLINEHPLAKDEQGRLKCRIGTVFPEQRVIVTLPGIHAMQRMAYLDLLDQQRIQSGRRPLTRIERHAYWEHAVDLVMEANVVLIRPDPARMDLAYAADEVLQMLIPKRQIRFLNVLNDKVREAIKRRGEAWRISRLPDSVREMEYMILGAKIGIGGREIYYYNRATGTRYLTCHEFARLGELNDRELRQHLIEIQDFSGCVNRMGNREIDLFQTDPEFRAELQALEVRELPPGELRPAYQRLRERFRESVTAPFRTDNLSSVQWRCRMYAALLPPHDDMVSEEELLGLSAEFYMQIQWLPGGRIEQGELIFDSVFDQPSSNGSPCPPAGSSASQPAQPSPPAAAPAGSLQAAERSAPALAADNCDDIARALILNLLREYGDLDYVNVGRVADSLSARPPLVGRRGVYLIEMKLRHDPDVLLKIVRLQKWGVGERLDRGTDLLTALLETEEYMDYILDRRLACRQLGMNLATRVAGRRLSEIYCGDQQRYHGTRIWTPYYERDYIRGMATDKIPLARFEDGEFAERFAALLGRAAAPNLIVGRCDENGQVMFDDGDEILVEDERGLPKDVVVADFTGAFQEYQKNLTELARAHAEPINCRNHAVPDPEAFAEAYLSSLIAKFARIRRDYRRRRRAFDTLFRNQKVDAAGSFAYRWGEILRRLDQTEPAELEQAIRQAFRPPCR